MKTRFPTIVIGLGAMGSAATYQLAKRGKHVLGSYFFDQTVSCAETYGIAHRLLGPAEIKRQFPPFKLRGIERGYFEEKAGYLVVCRGRILGVFGQETYAAGLSGRCGRVSTPG